jgi:hypothetical protein
MPDISLDKACFIVVKARAFGAKVEVHDPDSGSNPTDDRAIDALEDRRDDPVADELRGAIAALNEDESRDLVALTWVGRGDYTSDQWPEARAQAERIPLRDRARYLIGTAMLGDYPEEGLSAFDMSCEEIELGRL